MIMMLTIIKTKLKKNSKQNNNNDDDNDANDNNTVCVLNKPTIYNLLVRFKQRFRKCISVYYYYYMFKVCIVLPLDKIVSESGSSVFFAEQVFL